MLILSSYLRLLLRIIPLTVIVVFLILVFLLIKFLVFIYFDFCLLVFLLWLVHFLFMILLRYLILHLTSDSLTVFVIIYSVESFPLASWLIIGSPEATLVKGGTFLSSLVLVSVKLSDCEVVHGLVIWSALVILLNVWVIFLIVKLFASRAWSLVSLRPDASVSEGILVWVCSCIRLCRYKLRPRPVNKLMTLQLVHQILKSWVLALGAVVLWLRSVMK